MSAGIKVTIESGASQGKSQPLGLTTDDIEFPYGELSYRSTGGPCAKTRVLCFIKSESGKTFAGENWCRNPQEVCPRSEGEGYEKCSSICDQQGHAEVVAVRMAGDQCKGATATISGHTYACMDCQHALYGAGIKSISVEASQ